jgi:hypothetical protein
MSLEIKGIFIPPDQPADLILDSMSSFSNKKMGACKEGPCKCDPVTPDGNNGRKWKGVTP